MKYSLRPEVPAQARAQLAEYSDLSARLLYSRGIFSAEGARNFLGPDFEAQSHNPFLLKDAEKAAERIILAIEKGQKIVIYSDYDTDGIPAGAMFHDFFKRIGYGNFYNYVPHRHDEGFGLNNPAMLEIAENGAKLVITLDCGITDVGPVDLANDHGIEVIITDHHTPPAELPKAFAIVNPKQNDCAYPDKDLCGAGVGWKLIQAILKKKRFGLKDGHEKWLLDMVGIATLSDMVSLTGENRVLAYYGLAVLRKSPRKGLIQLLKKIGVRQKDIVEDDIGFSIAPRINAASRMGAPMDALSLLVADDEHEAERLAQHLDAINDERKGAVASLVKDVKRKIRERYSSQQGDGSLIPNVIVLGSPNWRPSLLGLAANTCAEEFNRPVFLWGRDGDGLYKGSCRAGNDSDVHLVELMTAVPALTFIQFGGHTGAGGFTVGKEIVFDLEKILNTAYESLRSKADQDPLSHEEKDTGFVDGIYSTDDITWGFYNEVNKFAPFGTGNPKPIFILHDAVIAEVKHFGKEKNHLELLLEKEGGHLSAIAFFKKSADFSADLGAGKQATVIGTLERSTFKRNPELRIRIVDVL